MSGITKLMSRGLQALQNSVWSLNSISRRLHGVVFQVALRLEELSIRPLPTMQSGAGTKGHATDLYNRLQNPPDIRKVLQSLLVFDVFLDEVDYFVSSGAWSKDLGYSGLLEFGHILFRYYAASQYEHIVYTRILE